MPTPVALSSRLPLVLASVLYLAAVAWLVAAGIALSDGTFTYPLDDTYIHLAVAKNVVQHGVWGVNAHEAVSASSSPLWTVLLSLGGAIGIPLDWLPLVLNVLAGLVLLGAADACWRDVALPPALRTLALAVAPRARAAADAHAVGDGAHAARGVMRGVPAGDPAQRAWPVAGCAGRARRGPAARPLRIGGADRGRGARPVAVRPPAKRGHRRRGTAVGRRVRAHLAGQRLDVAAQLRPDQIRRRTSAVARMVLVADDRDDRSTLDHAGARGRQRGAGGASCHGSGARAAQDRSAARDRGDLRARRVRSRDVVLAL